MKQLILILIGLVIFTDIFLLVSERSNNISWLFWQIITVFSGLWTANKVFRLKKNNETEDLVWWKWGMLVTLATTICVASLSLAFNKKSLDWDSVALYASRANFLKSEIKFSQMLEFSKYDDLNSYYYLLYPPYTTILHYVWDMTNTSLPPAIFYSSFLMIIMLGIYLIEKSDLGGYGALILGIVTISSNQIFGLSFFEYTNLPYTVYVVLGILLIKKYIQSGYVVYAWAGVYLFCSSQAIRFSEPALGVLLCTSALCFWITKSKPYLLITFLTIFMGGSRFLSWSIFTDQIAHLPNFTNITTVSLLEAIVGGFIGSLANYSAIFVKAFYPTIVATVAAILSPLTGKVANNSEIIFIKMFLTITVVFYFCGFYLLSFSTFWWRSALSESLMRSTIYLIPLSGYILIKNVSR